MVSNVITGLANGSTFINNSNTTQITTNAGFATRTEGKTGQTRWQRLQEVQEAGDGSTLPWVMGVTYGRTAVERLFYYRPQNRTPEYLSSIVRDSGRVRNRYGGAIDPCDVQADRMAKFTDVLIGWGLPGDDPRDLYIESLTYDGERQLVTLQGNDDLTPEGLLGYRKYFQPQKPLRATKRQIYV